MTSIYFNSEHEALRKLVRNFVSNEIIPHVEQWEEEGIFPASIQKNMAVVGWIIGIRPSS